MKTWHGSNRPGVAESSNNALDAQNPISPRHNRNGHPHRRRDRVRLLRGTSDLPGGAVVTAVTLAAKAVPGASEFRLVLISEIRPSPENDRLYRPVDFTSKELHALADSIRQRGILQPLVITGDNYIISGHRRFAAAQIAGLTELPCSTVRMARGDDIDAFVELLREHNRQRVKSLDEIVREEVVSMDPEAAYTALVSHRKQASMTRPSSGDITIREAKDRAEITSAKAPFLAAVQMALADMTDFLPVSVRQIHYKLLNNPPLKHASKPASIYENDKPSYKALCDLTARARVAGLIPFDAIADETRPVTTNGAFNDTAQYIRQELNRMFAGYWRDLQQSQPHHIEIIVEKNTVLGTLKPIAQEYTLPITSGRGYCSLPPKAAIIERFRASGKDKLVLLIVSDHDPDGEEIAHSLARSIRDDFALDGESIQAVKVALTHDQVQRFKLPPSMKAKESSTNYGRFKESYGTHAYELEALDGKVLQGLLRDTIERVMDMERYQQEVDTEKKDALEIEAYRARISKVLAGIEQ